MLQVCLRINIVRECVCLCVCLSFDPKQTGTYEVSPARTLSIIPFCRRFSTWTQHARIVFIFMAKIFKH